MKKTVRIGTRKSLLALVQTEIVKNALLRAFPETEIEIVKIDTKGDQLLDRSLAAFGGKGVFTVELEAELLSGAIDIAVHSAKDMPMRFPEGLGIGAVLARADARDTFVSLDGTKLAELTPGSVVGTSSLRRELQIKAMNPQVQVKMLRGNVQTRLRRLKEGRYDGIILAAAGIERLEYEKEEGFYYEYLEPETFLPAAGQGILAVESRTDDAEMANMLAAIHDAEAACQLAAERAFLTTIGGSCNAPAAAYCRREDGRFVMDAMFVKDGVHLRRAHLEADAAQEMTGQVDETGRGIGTVDAAQRVAARLGRDIAREVNKGIVYLVGAGPGDEDLITRKALQVLREADVVVYDSLASSSLLNEVRDDAELIFAGKRSSHHFKKQYETNQLLIDLAKEGKNVVRLKGGDPYIFGRGGEEGQELRAAGVDFVVVPGVSSSYSVPAYCGIPVTHRDYASSFHVITGHEGSHKNGATVLDYGTLAREEGTLIFLMGLKNLPNIVQSLIENGKDPETPAGVLQEGTTARQKMAVGTLSTIVDVVKREGIKTPAITVVGDVVRLAEELFWYGGRPLSGKRVLVTGSRSMVERLSPLLKEEGAEAISFSLIRTEPMETPAFAQAMEEIDSYTWIVLTSANGVECFFERLKMMRKDIRDFQGVHFAVIGDGTKKALESHGIYSELIPTAYSSKDMAAAMVPHMKPEDRVLLLRAEEANAVLPEALEAAGIAHTCVSLYHTVIDTRKADELSRLIPTVDYVTFASSSAVRAFVSMADDLENVPARYISIGPVTTKTAEKAGLHVDRTAAVYTAQGIVDTIIEDVREMLDK
ncbi:MAG TPA: hydroxymethylbilane synthase [Candidatus Merdibacter merdigallinarum]|nr:hydroxymethylbilane synthase [Candidatus Merdibacter merdigallinarum]